jgi:hypothetical protein
MFTDEHSKKHFHHEAAVVFSSTAAHDLQQSIQSEAVRRFPLAAQHNWVDLHASPMWNGNQDRRGWRSDWSIYKHSEIVEFFQFCCSKLAEHSTSIAIQPLRKNGTYFEGYPRQWSLAFLMQHFDKLCRTSGAVGEMYFDHGSNNKEDAEIQLFLHKRVTTLAFGPFSPPVRNVIIPPSSLSSTYSVGIQMADLVAYIYGRLLEVRSGPKWDTDDIDHLWELLGPVSVKTPWPRK